MEWIVEDPGAVETWTIDGGARRNGLSTGVASERVVEAVVPGAELRDEIARRFRYDAAGHEPPRERRRGVVPV